MYWHYVALFFGVIAIQIIPCNFTKLARWGYLFGLLSQLIWLAIFIGATSFNKFMVICCILNLVGYFRGIFNHLLKDDLN